MTGYGSNLKKSALLFMEALLIEFLKTPTTNIRKCNLLNNLHRFECLRLQNLRKRGRA